MHVSGRRMRPAGGLPVAPVILLFVVAILVAAFTTMAIHSSVPAAQAQDSPPWQVPAPVPAPAPAPAPMAPAPSQRVSVSLPSPVRLRPQTAGPVTARSAPVPPLALPKPSLRARVCTFNIRYGEAADGPNSWQFRRAAVAEVIHSLSPDVIGLQEALHWQYMELLAALNGKEGTSATAVAATPGVDGGGGPWGGVFIGRDDGLLAGEGCAVLMRLAVLSPAAPASAFWLSETPDVPGSVSWGAHLPRMALHVALRQAGEGGDGAQLPLLHVFNTHLDHESPEARRRGAALVLDRMHAAAPAPAAASVLFGDMNEGPGGPAVEALRSGLVDVQRVADPSSDSRPTFHAWSPGVSRGAAGHIDFIFAGRAEQAKEGGAAAAAPGGSGGEAGGAPPSASQPQGEPGALVVRGASIHTALVGGRPPSDHYPVVADLEWG